MNVLMCWSSKSFLCRGRIWIVQGPCHMLGSPPELTENKNNTRHRCALMMCVCISSEPCPAIPGGGALTGLKLVHLGREMLAELPRKCASCWTVCRALTTRSPASHCTTLTPATQIGGRGKREYNRRWLREEESLYYAVHSLLTPPLSKWRNREPFPLPPFLLILTTPRGSQLQREREREWEPFPRFSSTSFPSS